MITLQLHTARYPDIVICRHCQHVFWTGEKGWFCPQCGAGPQVLDSMTDRCERCRGEAPRMHIGSYWRECSQCGHMQRSDVVPRPLKPIDLFSI